MKGYTFKCDNQAYEIISEPMVKPLTTDDAYIVIIAINIETKIPAIFSITSLGPISKPKE